MVMCADAGVPVYDADARRPMRIYCDYATEVCGRFDNDNGDLYDEDGRRVYRSGLTLCKPEGGPR
jgi:hypothetical protein